jgi:hypothetical protein
MRRRLEALKISYLIKPYPGQREAKNGRGSCYGQVLGRVAFEARADCMQAIKLVPCFNEACRPAAAAEQLRLRPFCPEVHGLPWCRKVSLGGAVFAFACYIAHATSVVSKALGKVYGQGLLHSVNVDTTCKHNRVTSFNMQMHP